MRAIFIFFTILIGFTHTKGQIIKTPTFDFRGTKTEWVHTLNDPDSFIDPLFPFPSRDPRNLGFIYNAPLEIDNSIIFKINNYNSEATGDVIASYNLESGIQNWVRYLTPNKNDSIGFNFYLGMEKTTEKNISLLGIRSHVKLPSNLSSLISGFYSRLVLDHKSGEIITDKYISTETIGWMQGEKPLILENGSEMKYRNYSNIINQAHSVKIFPTYFDFEKDSIFNKFSSPSEIDSTTDITFFNRNANGSPNPTFTSGPFSIKDNEYMYLVEYEQDGRSKHFMWKVDKNAKILMKKEITEGISGQSKSDIYHVAEQKDSLVLLTMLTRDGTKERHRGYIFIDFDGNVVRKNTEMTIEGNKVGHIVTTTLRNSSDLLHAIRFQNSTDLYVYRETEDKKYIKAGHIVNPNTRAYALMPKFLMQTADYGIVISGDITLDTVSLVTGTCRFDCVGWPVIMKLSAETLGIPTSTSDAGQQNVAYTITPNPSSHQITVTIPVIKNAVTLHITDQVGRSVWVQDICDTETVIDISGLTSGMYFVSLVDASSVRQLGKVQKLVKVE